MARYSSGVRLHSPRTGEPLQELDAWAADMPGRCLVAAPDGSWLASVEEHGELTVCRPVARP